MGYKKVCSQLIGLIFEYDTVKIVSIKSKKVGLMCRFIQLIVMSYVIGYVIVYQKGYQTKESGISALISKVKGVSFTNTTERNVWDVADYVVPPLEEDAVFITTNALITRRQTQGKCSEDPENKAARCKSNADCIPFEPILLGGGVKTGICLKNGICEIYAWCPVESSKADAETIKQPLLKNVNNFTVFIKNNIEFKKFKVSRSNIPAKLNKSQLASCRYNQITDKYCPIFMIGTILNATKTNYDDIARIGGVISLSITWDCNLDFNPAKCFPTYSFNRLDVDNLNISKGWNFRYANYYFWNGSQYRDLIKAYGIRLVISVSSKAGKFDIIPLTMNLGSGIALLGIVTVICDFIVFYCLKNREKFIEAKYHYVSGEDAYQHFGSDLENNQ